MYHRSSNPASLRLRRILRNQQELNTPTSSATENTTCTIQETTDAAHNTDVRSRGFSQDYSASGKSSSASIVASETADEQQEQPQRKQKHKLIDSFSESSSPVMVYFRKMFLRCFTTRRKKRPRGVATRKMKSNNYQARDENDCGKGSCNGNGNPHGSTNPQRKTYASSIPTNEHEMFFALHSKSKPKRNINIDNIHTHTLRTLAGDTHTRLCSTSSPRQSRHNRSRSTDTIGAPRQSRHNRSRSTGFGSKTKHKVPTQSITLPTLEIEQKIEGQTVHLS